MGNLVQKKLDRVLSASGLSECSDGIYSSPAVSFSCDQDEERKLREKVALEQHSNYLTTIPCHHSIPVMDFEVDRFIARMPHDSLILDIGGCLGWHWRRLATTRPDVGVLIMDFVRANLAHAQKLLGPLVGTQVALLHADATSLPFPNIGEPFQGFNGIWTVQVFQHIPDFAKACHEAHRVLDIGGLFANYSLHITPLNRFIYRLVGKKFHVDGMKGGMEAGAMHLTRANDNQRNIVEGIFGNIEERYTENLFHPDLRLTFSGRAKSLTGNIDAGLGNVPWLGRWIARQRSFHSVKVMPG